MTCTAMIALEISSNSDHMPISKMPKHGILNRCGSQTYRLHCFFFNIHIKYWSDGGLLLILHIKYWSTYLYGRNLCLTAPYRRTLNPIQLS